MFRVNTGSDCQHWLRGLGSLAHHANAEQKNGARLSDPGHFVSSLWTAASPTTRGGFSARGACEIYSRLITIEWPCPRAHASGAVPASSESASGAMSLSTFITRASGSARPIRSLVKPQEARRQSHQQSRLRPNRVRNGLPAGGRWIRTIGSATMASSHQSARRITRCPARNEARREMPRLTALFRARQTTPWTRGPIRF